MQSRPGWVNWRRLVKFGQASVDPRFDDLEVSKTRGDPVIEPRGRALHFGEQLFERAANRFGLATACASLDGRA
ncbi:MAG: hypothetical protein IT450_09730, partial [Phycisphaerales bacterium]|nr:hypothetical protein [Phycisphaerales bacterium]